MDVLTDVLRALRLRTGLYCRSYLTAPWGIDFASVPLATFHFVDRGGGWLRLGEGAPLTFLASGDLVVFPGGAAHWLTDAPSTPAAHGVRMDQFVPGACPVWEVGGGGALTTLLCGTFLVERDDAHPLLALLPPLIHIRGEHGRAVPWLEATLRFLTSEVDARRPGSEAILERLTDVLFVQVIRAWLEAEPTGPRGWLGALRDPAIGAALALIHRHPERDWTVASLATAVSRSRSAFAARFTALVGEPPLEYLTRWRLHTAADLLQDANLSVAEVAGRVGYASEAAFCKAFKRRHGLGPGAYRRRLRQSPPTLIPGAAGGLAATGGA